MKHSVIRRAEMNGATLKLGGTPIDLSAYATTGLRVVAVGPSGSCKTNAGFLIAEQLSVCAGPRYALWDFQVPKVPSGHGATLCLRLRLRHSRGRPAVEPFPSGTVRLAHNGLTARAGSVLRPSPRAYRGAARHP